MKFSRLLISMSIISSGVIISSCSKNTNEIFIIPDKDNTTNNGGSDGNNGNNGNGSNQNQSLIQFTASMESVPTKALSAFPKGFYATIMAFPGTTGSLTAAPTTSNVYQAQTAGTLSPVSGSQMYLPNGSWTFASVATNQTTNKNPSFTSGTSATLSNGIDYMYWRVNSTTVDNSQLNVPITYTHSCAQVVVKLQAGNGITINSLNSATITPSAPTGTMNLSTGVITPSTALSTTPASMGVNQLVAQYTMLPLSYTGSMTTTFSLNINNEPTARNYQVSVPVPNGTLTPGDSYVFSAVVNANEIIFTQVSVTDWVTVDETGKPLYPTQI
ncbi:MAG: fimbrillin family protein [Bacteroidales bacterium]